MKNRRRINMIATARTVFDLLAVGVMTFWGFWSFALPMPGVPIGIAILAIAVLMWALFLSPRPVLATDRYARALVSLVFIACAGAAALAVDVSWLFVLPLAILAMVIIYFEVTIADSVHNRKR